MKVGRIIGLGGLTDKPRAMSVKVKAAVAVARDREAAARREGVIEGLERAEKIVFAKGFLDSADAISAELERIRRGE